MNTSHTLQARRLRRAMTDPEKKLWRELRSRRLGNLKFRRQECFDQYILDFYCAEKQICIEVDGGGHNQYDNPHKDRERDAYLEQRGVRTLRFWNHEIYEDLDQVLKALQWPRPTPRRRESILAPLPRRTWARILHPSRYRKIFHDRVERMVALKKIKADERSWDWHDDGF